MKTHLTVVEVVWMCLCLDWKTKSWQGPGKAEQLSRWARDAVLTPSLEAFGSLCRGSTRWLLRLEGPWVCAPARLSLLVNWFSPTISPSKIRFSILPNFILLCKNSLILLEEGRRHQAKVYFWRVYTRQYYAYFLVVSQVVSSPCSFHLSSEPPQLRLDPSGAYNFFLLKVVLERRPGKVIHTKVIMIGMNL